MAKACTGHNGRTQKKRLKEICSCALPVSLGLPCDFPWDFFICLVFF